MARSGFGIRRLRIEGDFSCRGPRGPGLPRSRGFPSPLVGLVHGGRTESRRPDHSATGDDGGPSLTKPRPAPQGEVDQGKEDRDLN